MDWNIEQWTDRDVQALWQYQQTLMGSQRDCVWEQRIVNTALPCYGRTSAKARAVAKQIARGGYLSLLDILPIRTMFDSLLVAFLLGRIRDFEVFSRYLDAYVPTIDNWASCDSLRFDRHDTPSLRQLSARYLASAKPFVRRVGVNVWFCLLRRGLAEEAFDLLDGLADETEYYVNMSGAWLLCECFIQYREQTLAYLSRARTNTFIINKGICKCRDSFRVSAQDKELLVTFRRR